MNYLKDRPFIVKINQSISEACLIQACVSQGGVLNPTLFSLFINDLPNRSDISKTEFTFLFADNISYIFKNKDITKNAKIQKISTKLLLG